MTTTTQYHLSLILCLSLFILMIIMNVIANTLPLNGETTGSVSFRYPNLFQPTGFTFSIWGIIYFMLGATLIHYLFQWNIPKESITKETIAILLFISLSSIFNILWLLTWHYHKIVLSTILIAALLAALLLSLHQAGQSHILIKSTISLYTAWISVALIANIAIALVASGLLPFSNQALFYTTLILIIGTLLAFVRLVIHKDILFGLVFMWAYLGILVRHLKEENLPQSYPIIIWVTSISIFILLISLVYLFIHHIKR